MKNFRFALIAALLIFGGFLLTGYSDSYYFKINKSFDIFGETFRKISTSYVHEIDPEYLMKDGINGMLENLDPYTVFIDETDSENIELITYGRYTGLGITVSNMDGKMTITGVREDYPAAKSGIRIGDRILRLDSVKVLEKPTSELRQYTRGKEGSRLDIFILRDGLDDTLKFTVTRARIQLDNIPYSGIVDDSIAYIRLDRFSKGSAEDIRSAIYELRRKTELKGLILDLRGNPGGIMESAIGTCEIFIEEGNEIVSTKGRNESRNRTYKSVAKPVEPDIPLAVLIDRGSASASEIVAGAIQDMDRGIIIGENSVGKGLVQTVFNLPYKTNLKVTTAKYYTPSGRSIQKIDYSPEHKDSAVRDTNYFYTKNGRLVPELDGIQPDTIVHYKDYPDFIDKLEDENMIFNFANIYRTKHDTIGKDFDVKSLVNEFKKFIKEKGFEYKSPLYEKLDELKAVAEEKPYKNGVLKKIKNLEDEILSGRADYVEIYKEEIAELLEYEILSRYMFEKELTGRFLSRDIHVETALELLKPVKYYEILSSGTKK